MDMRPLPGNPGGAIGAPGVPSDRNTILLVDDDPAIGGFAQACLACRGYRVLIARDSDQALRISDAHSGPIHLLIADQVMPPFLSGPELASCLRLLRPDLKVLYISGYGVTDAVADELGDACADFLAKPFEPEALIGKVDALMAGANPEAA